MARTRIAGFIAATALMGSLAACGTSSSPSASPAASSSTTQTASASASASQSPASSPSASASAPSSSASAGGNTIGALLAAFSSGDITVNHMPTADPSWVARVQTEKMKYKVPQVTDPKVLNLMALVDEAAREKDMTALARLCTRDCDAKQQAPLWAKPGVLEQLSSLIETAQMGEGTVLPDIVLTSPADYFAKGGIWTTFQNGTGGPGVMEQHWTGIKTQ